MRRVVGYVEGKAVWSENEEAGHARITKRGGLMVGCVTPGQFVATYRVGPSPEVRRDSAKRAAETVRRGKGLTG